MTLKPANFAPVRNPNMNAVTGWADEVKALGHSAAAASAALRAAQSAPAEKRNALVAQASAHWGATQAALKLVLERRFDAPLTLDVVEGLQATAAQVKGSAETMGIAAGPEGRTARDLGRRVNAEHARALTETGRKDLPAEDARLWDRLSHWFPEAVVKQGEDGKFTVENMGSSSPQSTPAAAMQDAMRAVQHPDALVVTFPEDGPSHRLKWDPATSRMVQFDELMTTRVGRALDASASKGMDALEGAVLAALPKLTAAEQFSYVKRFAEQNPANTLAADLLKRLAAPADITQFVLGQLSTADAALMARIFEAVPGAKIIRNPLDQVREEGQRYAAPIAMIVLEQDRHAEWAGLAGATPGELAQRVLSHVTNPNNAVLVETGALHVKQPARWDSRQGALVVSSRPD